MASMEKNDLMSGCVVIAYDATKERNEQEFKYTVNGIRLHGDILQGGDTLLVLGVLHRVPHPLGYQMEACPESFFGGHIRAMEEEVAKKVDQYVNMLQPVAEECDNEGVDIEIKITAGTPIKKVVLQEVATCNATWLILDRHLRRDLRFYVKQIPCKVALIQDNLSVDVLRDHNATDADNIEHKSVFSMSKRVLLSTTQDNDNKEQSVISCSSFPASSSSLERSDTLKSNLVSSLVQRSLAQSFSSRESLASSSKQELSGMYIRGENKIHNPSRSVGRQPPKKTSHHKSSDAPLFCAGCGMKTVLYISDFMKFSFSEIQLATDSFSKENMLGEGGYGLVYKGTLRDGQTIAAKVRKEASTQGFTEFNSELCVLSLARHKNIVMLLGYCCKENINILVYEYVCNKSLEWHLFGKSANVLDWHQRQAIAIGTAKGLRFLHEECRGSPIIHRDMRPGNILLTHDFVPMLGDFGLAKWKTNGDAQQTRILGSLGYLAPEYAENGIVSVRVDVYAFGIVLIQLISGRKAVDSKGEDNHQSLRQWAEPLIRRLALHEVIDPCIGESYDPYELYNMARAAYWCTQNDPALRPSMGEVVRLLERENDHFQHLSEQFMPHFTR